MPSSPKYSATKETRERKQLEAEAKAKGDQEDLKLLLWAFLILIGFICIVVLVIACHRLNLDARILWLFPLGLCLWFRLELSVHGFAGWIRAHRKRRQ
jgi:hypothetical protein